MTVPRLPAGSTTGRERLRNPSGNATDSGACERERVDDNNNVIREGNGRTMAAQPVGAVKGHLVELAEREDRSRAAMKGMLCGSVRFDLGGLGVAFDGEATSRGRQFGLALGPVLLG